MPAHEFRAANGAVKLDKKGRLAVNQAVMVPMKTSAVPVRVASVGGIAPKNAAPRSSPAETSSASTPRTHVVQAGDTLYSIAQRYNAVLADLLRVNHLSAKSVIQPGLRLSLP